MRYRLRQNFSYVKLKLDEEVPAIQDVIDHRYNNEQELLDDLYMIRASLISHGDESIANEDLQDLIRLVESFGFYLLHLDIRQESTRHSEAVAEILTRYSIDYEQLDESQRLQALSKIISEPPPGDLDLTSFKPNTVLKEPPARAVRKSFLGVLSGTGSLRSILITVFSLITTSVFSVNAARLIISPNDIKNIMSITRRNPSIEATMNLKKSFIPIYFVFHIT